MKLGFGPSLFVVVCALGALSACDGTKIAEADPAAATAELSPGLMQYLVSADPKPRRFLLGRYTYAPGETAVPNDSKATVAALAAALKAHPVDMVRIESYASEGGGDADEHLGAKRAHYFMKALEEAGVEKRRVLGAAGRTLPGDEPADPSAQAPVSNGRTDVILYRDASRPM
jgi:outer membrane protein OmpA-like peptidoglycan-associated protein